jgi:hypothetical protein
MSRVLSGDTEALIERTSAMNTSSSIGASVWSRLALAVTLNAVVWLAVAWALDWFGVMTW